LPVAYTPSWHALDTLTRSFYDGDGLLIGSLAPDGGLTRIEYDGKGRKIAEHRYVNLATTDNWTRVHGTLDQIFNTVPKDASLDVTLRWVYDGQDQLRYEIDGAGRVTEYRYWDNIRWFSIGKPRRIIQHAVALPSSVSDFSYASVQSIMAQHVENSNNRINWNIYNEKGQLVYTVDAESQVTHFKHDAGGRLIRTARFAEPINMSTMGQDYQWMGMVGVWVDARMGSARVERNYYNARGDLRAVADAENFITVFHHDTEGRVTHQQRFANKVPVEDWWSFHEIWNTNKGAAVDRYFGYDGLGREIETYDENGNRTWYGYYQNGLRAYLITAAWQDGESRIHYIYDQAGRLKHELVTNNELETYGWHGNSSTTQLHARYRLISPNWAYQMGLSAQGELQIYHNGNLNLVKWRPRYCDWRDLLSGCAKRWESRHLPTSGRPRPNSDLVYKHGWRRQWSNFHRHPR
jgi:YD repeat-containing protein